MRRTKIVATIGPATETEERLGQLLEAGLNVARLNFSHGTVEWHRERVGLVRRLAEARGAPVAGLQDLSGPKGRGGAPPPPGVALNPGEAVLFTSGNTVPGAPPRIQITVPELLEALRPGTSLFLDDGQMEV